MRGRLSIVSETKIETVFYKLSSSREILSLLFLVRLLLSLSKMAGGLSSILSKGAKILVSNETFDPLHTAPGPKVS